jgi:hypothetical protein
MRTWLLFAVTVVSLSVFGPLFGMAAQASPCPTFTNCAPIDGMDAPDPKPKNP